MKKKAVFCSACRYLLLIRGINPICVATCSFQKGALRPDIAIKGYVSAEKRNRSNNCKKFSRFAFFDAAKKKHLLIQQLKDADVQVSLYSVQEYAKQIELRNTQQAMLDSRRVKEEQDVEEDFEDAGRFADEEEQPIETNGEEFLEDAEEEGVGEDREELALFNTIKNSSTEEESERREREDEADDLH